MYSVNTKIKLITETIVPDEIGNQKATLQQREVFGMLESVSQSEYFSAGESGLKPEHKVIIWAFEYQGEKIAELNGVKYSIYRTFQNTKKNKIELYLTKKAGD